MKYGYWGKYGFLCALLACMSINAYADSIRCGRAVVKVGDSSNALLKKCGKPADKFSSRIAINENGKQRQSSVSNWVYRRSGQKDRVVSVYAGEVMKIGHD